MTFSPLVAVIDDDSSIRDAFAELLEVFNFKCMIFEGAETFLAVHGQGRFDCLITDLNLKGMSGLELQQKLATLDPRLPLIFISAHLDPKARSKALHSGAVAFLSKPVDDDMLYKHIIAALNQTD